MEELLTRCYSCLAEIVFPAGKDIVRCDCCARYNDRPKSEKKETDLMKYAHERRNFGEFDKAEAAYEEVLKKNLDEHEARWGVLLCKRGVIYLEDPATGESVITCRRKTAGSIMSEPDFRTACEDAPLQVRRQYERDAEYIDAIQREIRGLEREEPYDVFICYKETEPGTGERTEDSRRAMNVFQTLERRGYRTFYAPVSLKNHLGANYEAAIFHAIETAQVMLVLGTKEDYFRTTWMQSEWRRFLEKVDAHEKKLLVPLYADFPPSCLPAEFGDRFIQGLDMSDMGFMFDLENMLRRILCKEKQSLDSNTESEQNGTRDAAFIRIAGWMNRNILAWRIIFFPIAAFLLFESFMFLPLDSLQVALSQMDESNFAACRMVYLVLSSTLVGGSLWVIPKFLKAKTVRVLTEAIVASLLCLISVYIVDACVWNGLYNIWGTPLGIVLFFMPALVTGLAVICTFITKLFFVFIFEIDVVENKL